MHESAGLDTGLRFPGQVHHWEPAPLQNWMRDGIADKVIERINERVGQARSTSTEPTE